MDLLVKRFDMLEAQMAAGPAADAYVKLASEYSELQDIAGRIRELLRAEGELADLEAMLADRGTDAEMRALAEADLPGVEERIDALRQDIQILLLPKDAADEKNAILEIRAGTRWTRWTPDSNFSLAKTPLPETLAMISLKPPASPSLADTSSMRQPRSAA